MFNSLERIFLGMVGDLFVEMLLSSTSLLETPNKSWKLKVPVFIQQEPWKRHAIFEEAPHTTRTSLHLDKFQERNTFIHFIEHGSRQEKPR
jgi:hypothetical protein